MHNCHVGSFTDIVSGRHHKHNVTAFILYDTKKEKCMPTKVMPRPRTKGFAALPKERRSAIARLGGIAAHKSGNAHEFTPEEARRAGRKGGKH